MPSNTRDDRALDDDDEPTVEASPKVMQGLLAPDESTRRIPVARIHELIAENAANLDENWDHVLEAEDDPTGPPADIEGYLRERLRSLTGAR